MWPFKRKQRNKSSKSRQMSDPSAPPPNYGAAMGANAPYPQPGMQTQGPGPQGPPPKYEPPKQDPYPPQQPYPGNGYPPANYGTTPVQTTIILRQPGYGPDPATVECPNCRAFVTTATTHSPGALTWLSAGLICLFGCWMGCCLIPFCIDDLQDVDHRCPNCGRTVGSYARL